MKLVKRKENSDNGQDKINYIDVLLTEYRMQRTEINKYFDREIQIFVILLSALGVIYGIIFSQKIYDLLLFIPILIYPLYRRYKYGLYVNKRLNAYLIEIEEQIKKIITIEEWRGWQHFWEKQNEVHNREKNIKTNTIASRFFLFVLLPAGLSFLYSSIIWFSSLLNIDSLYQISKLHPLIHFISALIYFVVLVRALFVFYHKEPKGLIYLIR